MGDEVPLLLPSQMEGKDLGFEATEGYGDRS